jgi:isopropylmalate/homocitrate/citramalate synthase
VDAVTFGSSPFNLDARERPPSLTGRRIKIIDVTLREGEQAAEVAFADEDKAEIASALGDAGVPIVQVGYAGKDGRATRLIRAARPDLDLAALVVGWDPEAEAAMSAAQEAGTTVCSLLFRSTAAHLRDLGFSVSEAQERIRALTAHARSLSFRHVIFGPSFATLADWKTLERLYRAAIDGGASVISVADSTGVAAPWAMREMVTRMRTLNPDVGIRVHTHNDYGLALQNALASIEAGADWVETSVNGLGERAGNCSLDELVVALKALYGYDTGVDTRALTTLSQLVANRAGVPVPPMKPLVGVNCFANKLEIHVKTAAQHPELMEPFNPVLVGGRRTIKLGRGTGPTGVRVRATELGFELEDDEVDRLVTWVNERAVATKSPIEDDAFRKELECLRRG